MCSFEIGDRVNIRKGAFANFAGIVKEVDISNLCLIVAVEIFGRLTSVDVSFADAEKSKTSGRHKSDSTNLN